MSTEQQRYAVTFSFFGRFGGVERRAFFTEASDEQEALEKVQDKATDYSQNFEYYQHINTITEAV